MNCVTSDIPLEFSLVNLMLVSKIALKLLKIQFLRRDILLALAFYTLGMSYINNCTSYNNPSLMVRGTLFLTFSVLIFNPFFFLEWWFHGSVCS